MAGDVAQLANQLPSLAIRVETMPRTYIEEEAVPQAVFWAARAVPCVSLDTPYTQIKKNLIKITALAGLEFAM